MYRTKILLHGKLGKLFGKEHYCIANSTSDVIRYLEVNFSNFRQWVLDTSERGTVFRVRHGFYSLGESELTDPIPENKVVHITPLPSGAGRTFSIIAGIALIGLGAFGVGFLSLSPLQLIVTGGLLLVKGLMGGKPDAPGDEEDEQSFIFSGAANSARVGGRVPIVYGVIETGSTVASFNVRSYATKP